MIARLGVTARWAGGPNQLLVLAARRDAAGRLWVRVRLARRPNNANAWIRADRTVLKRTRWRVEIDVGDRTLTVFRANRILHRFRAVVGAPATPTPVGRFAIAEFVRQAQPRVPRPLGPSPHRAFRRPRRLRRGSRYGGDPRQRRPKPSRSARQRPIARLHPDRQPPDPLSGAPPRPGHAGHDPALDSVKGLLVLAVTAAGSSTIARTYLNGQGSRASLRTQRRLAALAQPRVPRPPADARRPEPAARSHRRPRVPRAASNVAIASQAPRRSPQSARSQVATPAAGAARPGRPRPVWPARPRASAQQ